ncbi:FkbM family methyltransferase [Nitratireductor sp. CH_MIT9313-5]|uniref:FkbM family methyltransferase n=1 Tax=Nitratireductor sp. CH_MIT9313-5 TaxID=3107764 RepID=UPI00300A3BBC
MSAFQRIAVDGVEYLIALPNKDTDYIQRRIYEEGTPYELHMLRDMARRLSSGDLVLDVGANVGNHSLYLAAVAGCRVHAFEPTRSLCAAIEESLALNRLEEQVVVHCNGLGREPAKAHFSHTDESNLGGQSLEIGNSDDDIVNIVRLDDIPFDQAVKAVKIDVEGMELAVLEGAAKLIERDRPLLYVECQHLQNFSDLQAWLEPYGYCYWDTFNATPTHLFIRLEDVTDAQRIERLMTKTVLNVYRLEETIAELRFKLDRANKKYRDATQSISKLKEQLHAADIKYRESSAREALLLHEQESHYASLRADLLLAAEHKDLHNRLSKEIVVLGTEKRALEKRLDEALNHERQAEQKLRHVERSTALISRNLDRANAKYRQVTRQLNTMRRSRTFKAARYFRQARGSWGAAIRLPLRLIRLARQQPSAQTVVEGRSSAARQPVLSDAPPALLQSFGQTQFGTLRVACIMDEFTFQSYLPECNLFPLTPGRWKDELEKFRPELLFVEAAWRGKDELWGNKVGHASDELKDIVKWCRDHSVPTVFWNKEDPVHFSTFLNTARLFDFVFTTDIDSIPGYKAALGHDRVYLLPFACQPRAHNPIRKYERKDAFCFAGAYYVRYPERTRDLGRFVEHLPSYRPLEIYDRNHGKDHPDYKFPEEYHPHIVGSLPFDQIDRAYKGYRYAINLNSIKQSQTMFARRVFELLASNTVTISNYSRGLRLFFGDLVITSDDGSELIRRVEALAGDYMKLRKFRLAGLRKVMREHTYNDRLAYVMAKVTGAPPPDLMPHVAVVARADSGESLKAILENFGRQSYSNKKLVVVVDDQQLVDITPDANVQVVKAADAELPVARFTGEAEWIAGLVAGDYYGPDYLTDLALATRYSQAKALGKVAHHRWAEGRVEVEQLEAEYAVAQSVPLRSALLHAERVAERPLATFSAGIGHEYLREGYVQAIDVFNYCREGMSGTTVKENVEMVVNDSPGLNEGESIAKLIERAEHAKPELPVQDDAPVLTGAELAKHFKPAAGKPYRFAVEGSGWQVESSLQDGKHDYIYAAQELAPEELGYQDHATFYLHVTPGLNVQLVMIFLDQKRERIGAAIKPANRNHDVPLPDGTSFIRLGLRLYGNGSATIKNLVLGHRRQRPAEIVGRSKYLLLTNHYPSYDDLYRNGFVHSRVLAYKEDGVDVDVFRLRKDEPLSYHEFQDVDVITGSQEALYKLLSSGRYEHVLVHFLDADMWSVLQHFTEDIKISVWVHGAEIHPWHRRKFDIETPQQEQLAKERSETRMSFWRRILNPMPANLKLVFVSNTLACDAERDLGLTLPKKQHTIIHNPIDTSLFKYRPKPAEQRKKILAIRPFASRIYANDLSVETLLRLSKLPFFSDLEVLIVGEGKLFEETVEPLKKFSNVTLKRTFLTREQIASLHKEFGLFLCPSRMDTQGVSRDEAMSSGLVPITTAVAAIPEFVDSECGILAPSEDAQAMAEGIAMLYNNPDQFLRLSENAAQRVRSQSGKERIIREELSQFVAAVSLKAAETDPNEVSAH